MSITFALVYRRVVGRPGGAEIQSELTANASIWLALAT